MKVSENFKLIWWVILLLILGFYLSGRYEGLISGKPNFFDSVVFIVWVGIALAPIFTEMKLFGLHLKQDIEQLKKDITHQLSLMKVELKSSIDVSSSNSDHVHIDTNKFSPATDDEIPSIAIQIRKELERLGVDVHSGSTKNMIGQKVPRINVELFKIRYSFEVLLFDYMSSQFGVERHMPVSRVLRELVSQDIISHELSTAILEILAICNHAVHGVAITQMQRELVTKTSQGLFEALYNALKKA